MDDECVLSFLSENPNISCKFIEAYISKPWVWSKLSRNPNITWEFIEQHLDKDWNWQRLSEHPNITWDIIKANPDKNWKWSYVSKNPNITWEIIKDNPSKFDNDWCWQHFGANKMSKGKKIFIEDLRLKIIKSNIIKRYWRNYSCNPIYPFAQKMILKRAKIS